MCLLNHVLAFKFPLKAHFTNDSHANHVSSRFCLTARWDTTLAALPIAIVAIGKLSRDYSTTFFSTSLDLLLGVCDG
jgi:hypothetical protein